MSQFPCKILHIYSNSYPGKHHGTSLQVKQDGGSSEIMSERSPEIHQSTRHTQLNWTPYGCSIAPEVRPTVCSTFDKNMATDSPQGGKIFYMITDIIKLLSYWLKSTILKHEFFRWPWGFKC